MAVTNLDPNRAVRINAAVAGAPVRWARGEVLTAPRVDAVNTFAAPDTVSPKAFNGQAAGTNGVVLDIPAKSIVVVQVGS